MHQHTGGQTAERNIFRERIECNLLILGVFQVPGDLLDSYKVEVNVTHPDPLNYLADFNILITKFHNDYIFIMAAQLACWVCIYLFQVF